MADVDWTGLDHALPGAPDVVALATGLETDVPVVLLPVRIETRFDTVEITDNGDPARVLVAALTDLLTTVRALADRGYSRTLRGTVKDKKTFKDQFEKPLYAAIEQDLTTIDEQVRAVTAAAESPITSGGTALARTLAQLVTAIETAFADARTALQGLRSEYQRDRFLPRLTSLVEQVAPVLRRLSKRVIPGLRLTADLGPRRGADAARLLGRTRTGQPLRPDTPGLMRPDGGGPVLDRPAVVIGDGTAAGALGARRAIGLDHRRLADTAAAVEAIRDGLARGVADTTAAGALTVLPPEWKADLLTAIAAVPGTDDLAAIVAGVPSGRADLDKTVPARLRDVVFELPAPVRLEHRLLVRAYPEPLAVDTHEPELTATEATDALAYWTETLAAGNDTARALGAWRGLCVGRTTRRAAWLAHVTEPPDSDHTPGALAADSVRDQVVVVTKRLGELARSPLRGRDKLVAAVQKGIDALAEAIRAAVPMPPEAKDDLAERIGALRGQCEALLRGGVAEAKGWQRAAEELRERVAGIADEPPPQPVLPATGERAGTWTRAATSRVLPDRFAVVTVNGGRVSHVAQGTPVPAGLALGLDPSAPAGGFSVDEDDNLVVDPALRWLVDYDEAVAAGMALTVPITADEARDGFDEVLVIGLAGVDADDGAERLAAMLDAHHYTPGGLALLPVGTPTNNTEAESAGHSSVQDPDAAYPIERGTALTSDDSDGTRLATALGVGVDHLAHIAGSDGLDADESAIATKALYAATIGHAVEELAAGLVPLDGRERLQSFVTGSVSARGLLPAFRVTDQPYGVLPVTALSRYVPSPDDTPGSDAGRQLRFDQVLLGVLRILHEDWSALRANVKHAHSPDIGKPGYDAQQHFLAMLGLQAVSVSASYRFAVNVASRGGVRGRPDLSLSFGIPNEDEPGDSSATFGPWALMERFAAPLALAFGVPALDLRAPSPPGGGVAAHWKNVYERLTTARAFELRHLHGIKPVRGKVAGSPAGLTALLAADFAALVNRARTASSGGVPLAEMLVRHALLAEARRAAVRILYTEQMVDDEAFARAGASSTYDWTTLDGSDPVSSWGFLLASVNLLDHRYGISYQNKAFAGYLAGRSMAEYLAGRGNGPLVTGYAGRAAHQPAIDALTAHADAVGKLAGLTAERVDVLVREHLDLGWHRLDAWLTGLAQRRLDAMRHEKASGARVGAYGWVENLRPDPAESAVAVLPPALAGRPGRPVVVADHSQGSIQTPSPAHAVTAAILRGGHVSQAVEGTLGNAMSTNLTSGRVRTALALIDGVRAGNDLGALLGYRMERFLHEYYAGHTPPVELDELIAPLRRSFPTVATVDPAADAGPERERQIVDGLAVIRSVLDWAEPNYPDTTGTLYATLSASGLGQYPWGLPLEPVSPGVGRPDGLPRVLSEEKKDGLLRSLDDLANALDALADLTTSEAVHQIVRGNHPRAAAVLQALAEGTAPPPAEIAQSPQSGLPVTHRLVLQLGSSPGWSGVPATPRALVEPAVDGWLARLLGDPAAIRVRVRDRAGTSGGPVAETSVADLGLRPLDLLAMLGPGYEAGLNELAARVLDHRRPVNIEPDQPGLPTPDPRDDYVIDPERAPEWGPGIRGIGDVSALLESVADLLGWARPATAAAYSAQGATVAQGTDTADADQRIDTTRTWATSAALELARLLTGDDTVGAGVLDGDPRAFVLAQDDVHLDPVSRDLLSPDLFWGARERWRAAIVAAASFGIQCAPPRRYSSRAQVCKELIQSAEAGYVELVTRLQAAADADGLVAFAQALFGEAGLAVPRIDLAGVRGELDSSFGAVLAGPADLDAWLEGAAAVREPVRHLSEVLLLGDADLTAAVAQLPYVAGELWLGGALPDSSTLSGRVSIVVYGGFPGAGATSTGLVVDEWTEVVPYKDQTTGVALHYDQPDATAPQCVLIAVPPERGRAWQLADLVATLHDTLEIARNRTVEPEHLGAGLYGQILPLAVGEVVPDAVSGAQSGGRVVLDFAQNNPGGH
jgi:hypothetical protein